MSKFVLVPLRFLYAIAIRSGTRGPVVVKNNIGNKSVLNMLLYVSRVDSSKTVPTTSTQYRFLLSFDAPYTADPKLNGRYILDRNDTVS